MKPPFAYGARTRLAAWVMEQARAFTALVAPWLAQPGDVPMRPVILALIVVLLACGLIFAVDRTAVAVRELLPPTRQEAQP